MARVTIVGAGSIVFCKTLILDILATDGLENTEFVLMAPTTRRTPQVERFVKRVIQANGLPAKVSVTTDRDAALRGADYVITTFQVGGIEGFASDYTIPLKHGVDQCIGDTLGPGGIFRAQRSIPVILDLARAMEARCPGAHLLNYVNPMAMVCWALGTTGVPFVGLCHGVQTTLDLISGYAEVPKEEIDFLCAGINHMAWFLRLGHQGRDLYPVLRERFERPEYYVNEKVRGEVFRQFGYFMTESTGHLAEYVPYFRKSRKALDLYCDEPGFGGESGAYYRWCASVGEKYNDQDILAGEPASLPPRSIEYGSYVIEALETGRTFKLNGNLTNRGMIANLPDDCCAEGPLYVDRTGLHPTLVGSLPPQCAALNLTNINVQRLAVEAAISGDPEHLVHACALDPLTSAVLTLKETREMVAEMLESQRRWLPQFQGRTLKATPTISIPTNVQRAQVPVDPALAIMARFQELSR
ncbi:MAG: alpha-galactosidase [Candidatus Latescibacterota bacterium]|jgi:alpha-galactosidase